MLIISRTIKAIKTIIKADIHGGFVPQDASYKTEEPLRPGEILISTANKDSIMMLREIGISKDELKLVRLHLMEIL